MFISFTAGNQPAPASNTYNSPTITVTAQTSPQISASSPDPSMFAHKLNGTKEGCSKT